MELRSKRELLVWLVELGMTTGLGALKRGEYLLSLANAEDKVPQPSSRFTDWLYQLRDDGLVIFDDSDAPGDLNLMRGFAVTAAGDALVRDWRSS